MSDEHTGIAASWCPICGDCTCPREDDGEPIMMTCEPATIYRAGSMFVVHNPVCPLHGTESEHSGPSELAAAEARAEALAARVVELEAERDAARAQLASVRADERRATERDIAEWLASEPEGDPSNWRHMIRDGNYDRTTEDPT